MMNADHHDLKHLVLKTSVWIQSRVKPTEVHEISIYQALKAEGGLIPLYRNPGAEDSYLGPKQIEKTRIFFKYTKELRHLHLVSGIVLQVLLSTVIVLRIQVPFFSPRCVRSWCFFLCAWIAAEYSRKRFLLSAHYFRMSYNTPPWSHLLWF